MDAKVKMRDEKTHKRTKNRSKRKQDEKDGKGTKIACLFTSELLKQRGTESK